MRDAAHLRVLPGSHHAPGGQHGRPAGPASQQKVCCQMHLANQSVNVLFLLLVFSADATVFELDVSSR